MVIPPPVTHQARRPSLKWLWVPLAVIGAILVAFVTIAVIIYYPRVSKAFRLGRQGRKEYDLRQYIAAKGDFEAAIKLDSHVYWFHNDLGLTLIYLKQYREARTELEIAGKLNPKSAFVHVNLSLVDLRTKDYDLAVSDAQAAIDLNPREGLAWNNLGLARIYLKQYGEAKNDLETAKGLAPSNAKVYTNLSYLELQTRSYEQAMADARTATQMDPQDGFAWSNLGSSALSLKRNNVALEATGKAVQYLGSATSTLNYGVALYRNGSRDKAFEQWKSVLQTGTPALRKLAQFYLDHPERA